MAVTQKFIGDSNQLVKEYEKILAANAKLTQALQNNADLSKKNADSQKDFFMNMKSSLSQQVSSLATITAGYLSMQSAIAFATKEIEHQNKVAEESRRKNISVADSQAAIVKNIGDVNQEQLNSFLNKVADIQKQTGFSDRGQLNMAASSVLSATGDQAKTIEILSAATEFFKDAPADLAKFAGSMADVMKATGDPNANRALALMLSIQGQSRFESLDAFKNVAPALASAVVTQGGVDKVQATREAAAVFAGLGQRAGDAEGSVTKTAVANLAANLQKAFPEQGLSFLQRLEMAQGSSQKVKDELARSGFEGAMRPIIQDLLSGPDSQTSKMILDAAKNINSSEAFTEQKRQLLRDGTSELAIAGSSRRTDASIEQYELSTDASFTAEVRKKLADSLAKTTTATQAQLLLANFDYGSGNDPAGKAAEILDRAAKEVKSAQGGVFDWLWGSTAAADQQGLSASRMAGVNLLEEAKNEIIALRESMDRVANNTGKSAQVPASAQRNTHQERD